MYLLTLICAAGAQVAMDLRTIKNEILITEHLIFYNIPIVKWLMKRETRGSPA